MSPNILRRSSLSRRPCRRRSARVESRRPSRPPHPSHPSHPPPHPRRPARLPNSPPRKCQRRPGDNSRPPRRLACPQDCRAHMPALGKNPPPRLSPPASQTLLRVWKCAMTRTIPSVFLTITTTGVPSARWRPFRAPRQTLFAFHGLSNMSSSLVYCFFFFFFLSLRVHKQQTVVNYIS